MWIEALAAICLGHLQGWAEPAGMQSGTAADAAASRQRALALGAPR
jgi:hypothetical protein